MDHDEGGQGCINPGKLGHDLRVDGAVRKELVQRVQRNKKLRASSGRETFADAARHDKLQAHLTGQRDWTRQTTT